MLATFPELNKTRVVSGYCPIQEKMEYFHHCRKFYWAALDSRI